MEFHIDDWAIFGFGHLDHVNFCFRQFAMYLIRISPNLWSPFNTFELWRFLYKLSKSSLVHGGTKAVSQSRLFTIQAAHIFSYLVERPCALENICAEFAVGPEAWPWSCSSRDRGYDNTMDKIRSTFVPTQLGLLEYAADFCQI